MEGARKGQTTTRCNHRSIVIMGRSDGPIRGDERRRRWNHDDPYHDFGIYIYISGRSYRGPWGEKLVKDVDGDDLSTRPRERVVGWTRRGK